MKYAYFGDILYYQFTAIDLASKVVYAQPYYGKTPDNAANFVQRLIKFFKIQTIQTHNGTEFTYRVHYFRVEHSMDTVYKENNIERVYSKVASPWYNGGAT